MATVGNVFEQDFLSGSAIGTPESTSADYFLCVKLGTTKATVALATSATDLVIGIVQQLVTVGNINTQLTRVRILGTSTAIAGGPITIGSRVTCDSIGRVVTGASGNTQVGIALSPASVAGDAIEVLLTPGARVP